MTETSPHALTLTLLLVAATLTAGLTPHAVASSESQCSEMVVHDDFRFDNSTVEQAANTSASSTEENTEARVEQATGFVRVHVENPNGYCNEMHVRLASEIVSPASLGEVESNDGNHSADWSAVRDFERNETYTEVVVTLPAGSQATFAPSQLRVKSLSWTGKAKTAGGGLLGNFSLPDVFSEGDLEQNTYQYSPGQNNSTEFISVALSNASTGRSVEEWQAVYRTSETDDWTPVSKESTAPVFYRKPDDSHIQFIFNDANATVKFTANPGFMDKRKFELREYGLGFDKLSDIVDMSSVFWIRTPTAGGQK